MSIKRAEALDRFIKERVLGDRGFAVIGSTQMCTYDKDVCGGCEIGQYIIDDRLKSIAGGVSDYRVRMAMIVSGFELPNDVFWQYLQSAHDALAGYSKFDDRDREGLRDGSWARFEESLMLCADSLKEA